MKWEPWTLLRVLIIGAGDYRQHSSNLLELEIINLPLDIHWDLTKLEFEIFS